MIAITNILSALFAIFTLASGVIGFGAGMTVPFFMNTLSPSKWELGAMFTAAILYLAVMMYIALTLTS